MRRFALHADRIAGDRVRFDREETRHLALVLRLRPGDDVLVTDGAGRELTVRLETLGEAATGRVLDTRRGRGESPLEVTLVQGIPKADKMEAIVRACTELGVRRIRPAICARTIVQLEPSRWRERARRWQRVAKEAAKQSGRSVIPDVAAPRPLAECLDAAGEVPLALCLWEGEAEPLGVVLGRCLAAPARVLLLVGPEGGLAEEEVALARARGLAVASLGPRILRSQTAGPAVLAVLQSRFGDLG
ncbi:MAG: 16S rRNA (uracil(1498)-N(3))-methyltransferase [Candidatus Rokubacteria bacterium]|nr:16S rRNA (uracil(1498)-N(3))-methyltransferase [Candidatus Rokubacteria bacterium]MBI3826788.1 16S rRNA (uracil(1498)-N(3))-methyltransferase [Candidatus Rokubacteria bacterium]